MIKADFDAHIDAIGGPVTHHQAIAPSAVTSIDKALVTSVGVAEETIINAWGVDAKKITIKADSLATPPKKHDRFVIGTQEHTVVAVVEKLAEGTHAMLGYLCYCKGN